MKHPSLHNQLFPEQTQPSLLSSSAFFPDFDNAPPKDEFMFKMRWALHQFSVLILLFSTDTPHILQSHLTISADDRTFDCYWKSEV